MLDMTPLDKKNTPSTVKTDNEVNNKWKHLQNKDKQ